MKALDTKHIAFAGVALLSICCLCFGQSTIKKTSVRSSAKAPSQSSSDKTWKEREIAVWESLKNKQFDQFRQFYADDFRSVAEDGFHDIKEEMEGVRDVDIKGYSLTDLTVLTPNKDTTILTFKISVKGSFKGQDISGNYNASSVWVNRGGKWLAVLYAEFKAQ